MIIEHQGKRPNIDSSAYIAPNATICGDVTIGKNCRIMFGAQLIAESSPITIGENCIVLENAVLRGTKNLPLSIGDNCLVGPNTHLTGCTIEADVFIATGAAIFHGAIIEQGAEIRINGVVHLKTRFLANQILPIGWIAIGNPAQLFSPEKHEEIWTLQKELNFPEHVYGISERSESSTINQTLATVMSKRLAEHKNDTVINTPR